MSARLRISDSRPEGRLGVRRPLTPLWMAAKPPLTIADCGSAFNPQSAIPNPQFGRRAFSLPEVIMVLAIVAILSAMAAPRLSNMLLRQRLDLASRRLMEDLQLVRSQAIRDNADRSLTLVIAGQYYSVSPQVRSGPTANVTLNASPYDGVTLVSTTFNQDTVVFTRLGVPQAGGTITLQAGAQTAVITVASTTGRATRTLGP